MEERVREHDRVAAAAATLAVQRSTQMGKRGKKLLEKDRIYHLDSLKQVLEKCMELRDRAFWSFRGQRNSEWKLGSHDLDAGGPSLDRRIDQFIKRCMLLPDVDHIDEKDTWRWRFFAQHHRLKTRLLDWTSNPLVAIYFAVENVMSQGRDGEECKVLTKKARKKGRKTRYVGGDFGVVWALKVAKDDFLSPRDPCLESRKDRWLMINPVPVTPRLALQSGKFSWHPKSDESLDDARRRNTDEELVKIVLRGPLCSFKPVHKKKGKRKKDKDKGYVNPAREIRRALGVMNVHHASLFPDADGIADFINREWPALSVSEPY